MIWVQPTMSDISNSQDLEWVRDLRMRWYVHEVIEQHQDIDDNGDDFISWWRFKEDMGTSLSERAVLEGVDGNVSFMCCGLAGWLTLVSMLRWIAVPHASRRLAMFRLASSGTIAIMFQLLHRVSLLRAFRKTLSARSFSGVRSISTGYRGSCVGSATPWCNQSMSSDSPRIASIGCQKQKLTFCLLESSGTPIHIWHR